MTKEKYKMTDTPEFDKAALMIKSSQFIQEEAKKLVDAYNNAKNEQERKEIIPKLESIQKKMMSELLSLQELLHSQK